MFNDYSSTFPLDDNKKTKVVKQERLDERLKTKWDMNARTVECKKIFDVLISSTFCALACLEGLFPSIVRDGNNKDELVERFEANLRWGEDE